jgi:drug/metabolite transporter (DMT)-like permease
MLIEPPMVALAGWAAFGEAPTLFEFAGSIVVVAALVGVVRQAEVEAVDDLDEEALEPPV